MAKNRILKYVFACMFFLLTVPSYAQSGPTGYTFAVAEGGTVNVSTSTSVAFGANGAWKYLTTSTSIPCTNAQFGGDPAVGVVKACFTAPSAKPPSSLTATQTAGTFTLNWTLNPSSAVVGSNGTVTATIAVTMTPTTTAKIVQLTWTAPAGTVTGYNVYRSTTSGANYVKITPNPVTSVSYQDGTVLGGSNTTYWYVVTSVSGAGESGYSNQASAVIP